MDGNIHRARGDIHQRILKLVRSSPVQMMGAKRTNIKALGGQLHQAVNVISSTQIKRLAAVQAQLEAVGPERVLARGYSVTMRTDSGELVRDSKQLAAGQELLTRLHKGKIYSTVKKTEEI